MKEEKNTLIVPVGDTQWEMVEDDGIYVRPKSLKQDFSSVAFYRTSPVSAITHIADVKERKVRDSSFMDAGKQLSLLGDFNVEVDYIEVENLREVEDVEADGRGIQRFWYVKEEDIKKASSLKEIQE